MLWLLLLLLLLLWLLLLLLLLLNHEYWREKSFGLLFSPLLEFFLALLHIRSIRFCVRRSHACGQRWQRAHSSNVPVNTIASNAAMPNILQLSTHSSSQHLEPLTWRE